MPVAPPEALLSAMPWQSAVPPSTLKKPDDAGWWWAQRPGQDWTLMFETGPRDAAEPGRRVPGCGEALS